VDITFWVIQVVLLTPVLFMAASAGTEGDPKRLRSGELLVPRADGTQSSSRRQGPARRVAVAVAGLSQFTIEQQARLVILRTFVQEARARRNALSDDLAPDESPVVTEISPPRSHWRLPGSTQLVLVGAALCMVVGVAGVARTVFEINSIEANSRSVTSTMSPAAMLLPGALANPGKYLSAVNGAGGGTTGASGVDELTAVTLMYQKQAMDRWEALIGLGLSVLLFMNASRIASQQSEDEESSVGTDMAPFILVAAFLFAALSFFELP
jgi:hypothetical protein